MTEPRSRQMALLTVAASVVLGIGAGVLLDRAVLHRRPPGRGPRGGMMAMLADRPDSATRARERARIVGRMTEELSLTPAQVTQVDQLFAQREDQLDAIRVRIRPALDSLRDAMRQSMDSVLTPEQRTKFAAIRARMEARVRQGGPPR
jgi:Spy/CpxP family protein refolding chaperone